MSSPLNQLPAPSLILPIDANAVSPAIAIGGGVTGSSGTGIYGDELHIRFAVGGVQVASIDSTGIVSPGSTILVFNSTASVGGAAAEVVVVAGLLASDTILSVSQSVKGANNLPLLGFNTQALNALTVVYSADPGAGAIVKVAVKR